MTKRIFLCFMLTISILTVCAQTAQTHTVQRGESLESIAQKYSVSVSDLKQANPAMGDFFYVGLVLNIPTKVSTTPTEMPTVAETQTVVQPSTKAQVKTPSDKEILGYYGLGFYSYDGGENYSLSYGIYTFNGFGIGMNLRSNWKFSDYQGTFNGDVVLNYSFGAYDNGDLQVLITPEIGPSIGSRYIYNFDDGKMKEKYFIDGFLGIKGTLAYKKVRVSAGYHIWAPKWKFGKNEKVDGFYAQIGFEI